jgi:hypothetical protein
MRRVKEALRSHEPDTYKVWIMAREAQASGRWLALYCVFKDDTPLFTNYTPAFSSGALLLALSSALHRLRPGNEVLIFFQDASFPASFPFSPSPNLAPLTHTVKG